MAIDQLFDISGRVAVVTGGASGIGAAIARALAQNGASVIVLDRDPEVVVTAGEIVGDRGASFVADVTDRDELESVFGRIDADFGGIDAVFANAGLGGGPGFCMPDGTLVPEGAVENSSDAEWDSILAVNILGVRNTLGSAARLMKLRGRGGRMIITSSAAAHINVPFVSTAYHASKAAVSHLMRQLALELAPHGILVNAISPANFVTNIGGGAMHLDPVQQVFARSALLDRCAEDHEIAGVALLLASKASSYITGVDIRVDGGACLNSPF